MPRNGTEPQDEDEPETLLPDQLSQGGVVLVLPLESMTQRSSLVNFGRSPRRLKRSDLLVRSSCA
jgi:hypothetical protein